MSQLVGGAGALCPRFSQNAWKKELCSNCFKSKEEHTQEAVDSRSRYLASLYAIRTPTKPEKPPQSILKSVLGSKKSSSLKVNFPAEESKVIGYGGEEFSDDEEVFDFEPDAGSHDDDVHTDSADDDKDLQRLTKSNTDFNSVPSNLAENADTKKPQMPLQLGQPKTEKDKKSTPLLVSIKPFGSSVETNISASRKSHLIKLLDDGKEDNEKTNVHAQDANYKTADKDSDFKEAVSNNEIKVKIDENKKNETSLSLENSNIMVTFSEDSKLAKTVDTLKTDSTCKSNKTSDKTEILKSITNSIQVSTVDLEKKDVESECVENGIRLETNLSESTVKTCDSNDENLNIKTISTETSDITTGVEVRKTQITRGSVLTKSHEQVKTKRFQSSGITLKLDDLNQNERNIKENMKENCGDIQNVQSSIKFDTNNPIEITNNVTVQQKNFKNITEDSRGTIVNTNKTLNTKEQTTGFNYISAIATLKNELKLKQINGLTQPIPSGENDKIKLETRGVGVGGKDKEDGSNNQSSNLLNGIGLTFKNIGKERIVDEEKEVTLQVMKILNSSSEGLSREMAGEPDGRADSDDLNEPPPALPLTPPPSSDPHPRPSFLHSLSKEKPKIPAKPKVPESLPVLACKDLGPCEGKLLNGDVNYLPLLDPSKAMKRQAPKPPPISPSETPTGLFQRNPSISTNPDSPVVKEREKRERANSCSPLPTPEPSPRRTLSLSHDSLAGHIIDQKYSPPEKICTKRGNKVRSTLRKILRFGSRDEECMRVEDEQPPALRPRPEIIHPLDLNKSAVQVLRSDGTAVAHFKGDGVGMEPPSSPPRSQGFMLTGRPSKPPPPPRSQSLDMGMRGPLPVRPPPPKVADLAKAANTLAQQAQAQLADIYSQSGPLDGVYANLGEARMDVMPEKPQRTGSLRDTARGTNAKSDEITSEPKEKQNNTQGENSSGDSENVYESLVPECDLPPERSLSLTIPYCGSETESDIYYPYTFSSSEEGADDETEGENWRLGGVRKGRSVMHSSLEENYGAVIVANHEALTQLLEQANNRCPSVPSSLRTLRNASNVHWNDFKLEDNSKPVIAGNRIFYGAHWGESPVTLCVNTGQARVPPVMGAITEFNDLVPQHFTRNGGNGVAGATGDHVQVLVSVLPRQSIDRLQRHKWPVSNSNGSLEAAKEAALVMVQLVNSLKSLQAKGIEEADLSEFMLCRDEKHNSLRICLLPNDPPESKNKVGNRVSLCQCVIGALNCLPLPPALSNLLSSLLREERATSLSQAKAVLEFWLWGPGDVPLTGDRQMSLQRWLDLERATVLHLLVISFQPPPRLNSADHCHLSFLAHTSAKVMADASLLFEMHRNETSGV